MIHVNFDDIGRAWVRQLVEGAVMATRIDVPIRLRPTWGGQALACFPEFLQCGRRFACRPSFACNDSRAAKQW